MPLATMSAATHRLALAGLAAALSGTLAAPASADLITQKALSATMAVTLATESIAACKAAGYAVSVTVVGRNGEPLIQLRGDGTGPHTMENSFKKAFTARTFPTSGSNGSFTTATGIIKYITHRISLFLKQFQQRFRFLFSVPLFSFL